MKCTLSSRCRHLVLVLGDQIVFDDVARYRTLRGERRMTVREFKSELWLPLPPAGLFPFFGEVANLDAITPPWLNFRILTPLPVVMREGMLIDYRLRVHAVPLRWRTRISAWQPPHRFVDEQLRGPYRLWIHEHTFEPRNGGTLARDLVRYAVPFDALLHRWFVRPDIERIFQFRAAELKRRFAAAVEFSHEEGVRKL